MGRGDLVDAFLRELNHIVCVVHYGEHGAVDGCDHRCLCLTILAREQADPLLDLGLFEVVQRTYQYGKQLNCFDSFYEHQHILVFEHVCHCVVNQSVVTIPDRYGTGSIASLGDKLGKLAVKVLH